MPYSPNGQAAVVQPYFTLSTPATPAPVSTAIREGYYSEPQTFTTTLDAYEALIGRRPPVYMWYRSFNAAFPLADVQAVAARGQIPMISWMPDVTGGGNPSTNANIIAGTWDSYIDTFAAAVKAYGGPVWLRLGFEMNGTWFQWGATNFVGMWARVQDRFWAQNVDNVTWVWSPNTVFPGSIPLDQLFPGVSRVDVVGLDGYNWGSPTTAGHDAEWRTWSEVFGESIAQVRALAPGKPFWITEMSSSELGGSKAAWITDALGQIRHHGLDGWIWFDANKVGEPDFRVNSSASSLAAMRAGMMAAPPPPEQRLRTAGRVPLAVRLVTADADRDITADLQAPPSFRVGQYGFASATLALSRPLSRDAPEIAPFGRVHITDGRHGGTVWEGYMEDPGRGAGSDGQVWEISALGPSARAEDRTAPYCYIDRGFDGWSRADNTTPGGQVDTGENPGIVIGAGEDAMTFRFPQGLTINTDSRVAMRYLPLADTGQNLAVVNYRWDAGDTNSIQQIQLTVRDAALVEHSPLPRAQNFSTAGSSGQVKKITTNWPTDQVFADLRIYRLNTLGTVSNDGNWAGLTGIYVMGTRYSAAGSVLTSASAYTDGSVLASEVVADVLGRLLPTYDGPGARIDTSSYQIDHLAFMTDGATARQIIDRLIELEPAYYFAAWESHPCVVAGRHRAEWRTWPTSVRYEATTVDGYSAPSSVTDLYDRVTVRWNDVRTRPRRTVRTQVVPVLADAGIVRQGYLDLGSEAGSAANAVQAGDGFLAEHATPAAGGSLTVARPILDRDTGRMVQPWEIRPNTLIRITDLAGRPDAVLASVRDGRNVCRVAATSFDGGTATAALELDTYPRSTAQALARLARFTKKTAARR